MKLKQTLTKGLFLAASLLLMISVSSCKKDNQYDFNTTASAKVNLVNTSPDEGSAALYVAGALRTPTPVTFMTASGYFQTYVGSQPVEIRSTNDNAILATSTQQIDANANYTAYLVGQGAGRAMVFTKDDLTAPATGKVKVRFVNASADLPSSDLVVNNNILFSAQAYKSASNFVEVGAGTLSIRVNAGTRLALGSTDFAVTAGKIYTVYVKGTASASGRTALSVAIVAHN